MPIYLDPPAPMSGGPDGKGWNRIAIGQWTAYPRCVLRPLTPMAFLESLTRRPAAHWSSFYDICINAPRYDQPGHRPDCSICPITTTKTRLSSFEPRILVRYLPDARTLAHQSPHAHLMNRPDDPASSSQVWTWAALLALDGWVLAGRHVHDGYSAGFWIRAIRPPANGIYR